MNLRKDSYERTLFSGPGSHYLTLPFTLYPTLPLYLPVHITLPTEPPSRLTFAPHSLTKELLDKPSRQHSLESHLLK